MRKYYIVWVQFTLQLERRTIMVCWTLLSCVSVRLKMYTAWLQLKPLQETNEKVFFLLLEMILAPTHLWQYQSANIVRVLEFVDVTLYIYIMQSEGFVSLRRAVVPLQKVLCNSLTPSTFNIVWNSNRNTEILPAYWFQRYNVNPPSKGNRRHWEMISITEIFPFIRDKQPAFRRSNRSARFRYESMNTIYPIW